LGAYLYKEQGGSLSISVSTCIPHLPLTEIYSSTQSVDWEHMSIPTPVWTDITGSTLDQESFNPSHSPMLFDQPQIK